MKMSKTSRRTILLALLAAGGFAYSAIAHFDIEPKVMLNFFVMSFVLVVLAALMGGVVVFILNVFRKS